MRVDYYDANTKVLKDPYALYEIENAKDYYTRTNQVQPSSVGDDYKVYVTNEESETIKAFRKGDQWFLPNGTEVSGGNIIYQGTLVYPFYAGKDNTGKQTERMKTWWLNGVLGQTKTPRLAESLPICSTSSGEEP